MILEDSAAPLPRKHASRALLSGGAARFATCTTSGSALLVVATDRLSAFDVVLPTGIPDKGIVLTQLSLFWFRLLGLVARTT